MLNTTGRSPRRGRRKSPVASVNPKSATSAMPERIATIHRGVTFCTSTLVTVQLNPHARITTANSEKATRQDSC